MGKCMSKKAKHDYGDTSNHPIPLSMRNELLGKNKENEKRDSKSGYQISKNMMTNERSIAKKDIDFELGLNSNANIER
jgi:hypothetical protein